MTEQPSLENDIDIVEPAVARANIEAAILERLGANWADDWLMVHDTDFLVRLNQGEMNLDFHADLLGQVEVTEKEANPLQLSGRFVALTILATSIFVALAIAVVLRII